VIVAVVAVWMVQPAVYEIVNMVAMRDGFVTAVWAVLMSAVVFRRAARGICRVDRDDMLVDVVLVHVMKVTIVKIVHVVSMPDRGVAAVRAMPMGVVGMVFLVAGHDIFLPSPAVDLDDQSLLSAACSIALCTSCRTCVSMSA
jgi:hypothetical protein